MVSTRFRIIEQLPVTMTQNLLYFAKCVQSKYLSCYLPSEHWIPQKPLQHYTPAHKQLLQVYDLDSADM